MGVAQTKIIGIGEYAVARNPSTRLKTMALGSCVAVCLYHPPSGVAGMAHVALPEAAANKEKAIKTPAYFADSGIKHLLNKLAYLGNISLIPEIRAKLVGGAAVIYMKKDSFNIGARNIAACRDTLRRYGVLVKGEHVGGTINRTVTMQPGDDGVFIYTPGVGSWTI
ncbi:MAG: chemotaxis protein CheD [Ignavibacteriales bacterium]|nr:chemotaxis protein CheD [Ignavibacteriales bacterium]